MAGPYHGDRAYETTATTGTGTVNLAGTATGSRILVTAIGNGNTMHYCIAHQTLDEWEVGQGTVTDGTPDTLSRTTIFASSNAGSAVNFSAGTKDVFSVAPAIYGIPLITMPTTFAVRRVKEDALSSIVGNARGNGATDLQLYRDDAAQVASGVYSFIGSGTRNKANGSNSAIVGGNLNIASGTLSFVGGGSGNSATGTRSTTGGGGQNAASQNYNFCGGGYGNNAGGSTYSSVVGGLSNQTAGSHAFVGGGQSNVATGSRSAILGGRGNTTNGTYSAVLCGKFANTTHKAQIAHAADRFVTNGDIQTSQFALYAATTNATPTNMTFDGTNGIVLSNDSTYVFEILIVARRTDANDESAGYKLTGVIDRNANAASTALVGTVTKTVIAEDTAAWDVDATANTTSGGLNIVVTGEASKNITWHAFVRTSEVIG